jgi:UDP-N-acetylglucosamine 2-epimerase (non-hydrolysing)
MICVVYGTTGELIKLAPVLVRIREAGGTYLSATTGQQVQQIPALLDELSLPQPDVWLGRGSNGRDLHTNADIPGWLGRVARTFARERTRLRRRTVNGDGRPLVLVHGDTMTTVLGTLMGRAMRLPVAHIEAGVRTWDVFHPFPEELNRRLVSRIAQIHYAPGPAAAANLRRGIVVDTGTNTIRDSVHLAPRDSPVPSTVEGRRYGLVSLHRYELLKDRELLRRTLETLAKHAAATPLLFVDHPVTAAAIGRFGLGGLFDEEQFIRMPRVSFFAFVELLRRSAFLVTDSGGSQVESFELDVPCLVHRKKVEQPEGVGENVVVSGFSTDELERFLSDPGRHRRTSPRSERSPADVIVADLRQRGYLRAS